MPTKTNAQNTPDLYSSYTWAKLRADLDKAGLSNQVPDILRILGHESESHLRFLGRRFTGKALDAECADQQARFALNVQCLRAEPVRLTADEVLNRPQHWLAAWAIAEKLEGRP